MNKIEQLKEMKKRLVALAMAAGMTLSSAPSALAEKNDDSQLSYSTMMSLENIKSSNSSKIDSMAQFDKLVNNLVNELKNKSVVSESGKPFTYAQVAPYVFMLNQDNFTDSMVKELVNEGMISSEIEKTIVAAFSVEDGIKGHNLTLAVLNADPKELDFGIKKLGKTKKQKVTKNGEWVRLNYVYAFNDTPFVKNRTSEKIKDKYGKNVSQYYKDTASYSCSSKTVIEYLNKSKDKTGLKNLEKSINIKAVGKKEYTQSEMVDVTVAIANPTEKNLIKTAFDDFYNSSKSVKGYNKTVEKYEKMYARDEIITNYGVGTHWALRPYTTGLVILSEENPYITSIAYSNATTNEGYKIYMGAVNELDEYSVELQGEVDYWKQVQYTNQYTR